jgi:cellulose synthase/poly-beta-1,6-N-acetylglucosamine synthase-like glycosyltransferase
LEIFHLHIVDYILLGVLAVLFLGQFYFLVRYLCAPARKMRRIRKSKAADQPLEQPGVSVVLCAHNEAYNLSQYLQGLLSQDYPEYEVIVVDDGSEDETRSIVESFMVRNPRLHMTFVPLGARVGSTKKLALTLAAKAAKYDYLLLTDADCVPESEHWIREMMKGFHDNKDIVLGFGAYFSEHGYINRLVRFDTLFNGLHYLGAALCGHPYMGVGRNLAYRKSFFFEMGGFTHLMTNRAGDDDLFVNHVATKHNTSVVINRDATTWSPSKKTLKEWWQQKRRHVSVSPNYRLGTKIRLALEPVTRGLFYALTLYILIRYEVSIVSLAALGLFLLRWMLLTAIMNISARRIGMKRFYMASVLWFDIALPLVNLYMLIVPKRKNSKW